MTLRTILSNALEVVGLAAVVCAAYLFDWRLCLAVGGAILVLAGLALDGGPKRGPES